MVTETIRLFTPKLYDSVKELVEILAFGRFLRATYTEMKIDPPEWFDIKLTEVERALDRKQQDDLAEEIRETEDEIAALRTTAEKRAEAEARLKKLAAKKRKMLA